MLGTIAAAHPALRRHERTPMSDEQATTETGTTHAEERTAASTAPTTLGSVANPRRTRR